jgi:hypothetical protein
VGGFTYRSSLSQAATCSSVVASSSKSRISLLVSSADADLVFHLWTISRMSARYDLVEHHNDGHIQKLAPASNP